MTDSDLRDQERRRKQLRKPKPTDESPPHPPEDPEGEDRDGYPAEQPVEVDEATEEAAEDTGKKPRRPDKPRSR